MIAFFPQLYPNELLYSAFARYFDKSGYGIYRAAAEDIFENSLVKPDILFVNRLQPELIDILTKQKPWERIIAEHTMYPHYVRFLSRERRHRAFQSLVSMDGFHRRALQMPNAGDADRQFLRYCPLCSQHDRKTYGETYWHRQHQMYGVTICPEHGCHLIDSNVFRDVLAFAVRVLRTMIKEVELADRETWASAWGEAIMEFMNFCMDKVMAQGPDRKMREDRSKEGI